MTSVPLAAEMRDWRNQRVTYMLRRKLVTWNREGIVAEAIEFCLRNRIDEVMWITECTGMYEELLPLHKIEALIDGLQMAKEKTEAAGIIFSINPLTTMGHSDIGGIAAEIHPGMQTQVDYLGAKSDIMACPICPQWRDLITKTFALYACTKPARLWLEDDFRYVHFGPKIFYSCFCPLHMKAFSERIGQTLSREQVVEAILRPGEPDPVRKEWMNFQQDTMLKTGEAIAETVHAVSPETELGWMSISPRLHEIEARSFSRQLEALSGGRTAAVRLNNNPHSEGALTEMFIADGGLKHALHEMPDFVLRCLEVEGSPCSLYAKSCNRVLGQITWSCVLNVPHITLNIFDYLGAPMDQFPQYGEMLRERKPFFSAVHECFAQASLQRGIGMVRNAYSGHFTHTKTGESHRELMGNEAGWADPLRAFGFSVTWGEPQPVMALTGEGPRLMSPEALREQLGKGLLLDASAFRVMEEMGLGKFLGVRSRKPVDPPPKRVDGEELTDPEFGGGKFHYTWGAGSDLHALELLPGAREISRIVRPDRSPLAPAVVLFENELGGRIAVFAHHLQGAVGAANPGPVKRFYSRYREQQVRAVVEWLHRGPAPLLVGADGWVMSHRADGPECVVIATMNVSFDPWTELNFRATLKRPPSKVELLDQTGEWNSLESSDWNYSDGLLEVKTKLSLGTHHTAIARIRHALAACRALPDPRPGC